MLSTKDTDRLRKRPEAIVVAEVAGNHAGDFDVACKYIEAAARAGAQYVKFQKRDIEAIPDEIKQRRRDDEHAFGGTEYEHRRALEFSIEQHASLREVAEAHGIRYACSAWDERSYNELHDLGLDYIKIPSARNTDWEHWKRRGNDPLHISLGMVDGGVRDRLLREHGEYKVPSVLWYACTSKYPADAQDTFLLEIPYLLERAGVCGFSGHHRGIQLDIAAYMLGATWIERHFTLDRAAKGTDHAASLEPGGLAKLVRDLAAIREALKPKPYSLPECEKASYLKLKGTK